MGEDQKRDEESAGWAPSPPFGWLTGFKDETDRQQAGAGWERAYRDGYARSEREAALFIAAIITQTGPVRIPQAAMEDAEPLTLRIVKDDADGSIKVSLEDQEQGRAD